MSVEMKYIFSPLTYFLIEICPYVLSVLTVMILIIGIVIAPEYPTKEWKIMVLDEYRHIGRLWNQTSGEVTEI